MNTLLGQEIFAIPYLMGFIACGWLLLLVSWELDYFFTKRDRVAFTLLFLLLAAGFGLLIAYPLWPVTPWRLLQSYWQKQ